MNPLLDGVKVLDLTDEKPEVETVTETGYPWDEGNSPTRIKMPFKKLANWTLNKTYDEKWKLNVERTPAFPAITKSNEPTEYLKLVPYGTTFLRLTVFPKLTK